MSHKLALLTILILITISFLLFFHKDVVAPVSENDRTSLPDLLINESMMKISSPAFENTGEIPSKYTCDGDNVNPPLSFVDIPDGTKSLALTVDDPDAPVGLWVHWLVWNIDPQTNEILENSIPLGSTEGITSFGKAGYGGPCPPDREHRYFFKLYALDITLDLPGTEKKDRLENAIQGHILAQAELMGRYDRKR